MKRRKLKFVVTFCLISVLVLFIFNIVAPSSMGEEYEMRQKRESTREEDICALTIDITSPEEEEILNESDVLLEWISEDADYHETRINEEGWQETDTETSHTFEALDDGEHMVDVKAVNETDDNEVIDSVNFTVDTTPPDVDITAPEEGEIFDEDEVTVEWTASDDTTGIDHYEIRLNEHDWIDKGTYTNHTFSDLEDGDHTAEVRAWDNADNSNTDIVGFTVDTTQPELDITAPEESAAFDVDEVTVEWTGSDETTGIDYYEIRLNRGDWIDKGTYTNHTFLDLNEQEHNVEVRAWDNAGNDNIEDVNFTVDMTPPDIDITGPDEGEILSEAEVTVNWTGSDDISGIDYYEVRLDEGNWTDVGTDTDHTFVDLEDGDHTVEVRAWDNASNNNTDMVNFTVDATPPDVNINYPEDGELFDVDEVTVNWTGSDETTGIDFFEVKIDGGDWTDVGENTSHTFLNITAGDRTVEVRAWDNAGNNDTDSVYFIVDTVPPEIDITYPEEGDMLNEDTITVTWTGSDNLSGIAYYEIRRNGGSWSNVEDDTEYTYHGLSDGEHDVEVRATDNVGNYAIDMVNFTIDTVSPEVDITAPEEDEIFTVSNVTLEWTGSDETTGIDHYEVKIDGDDWIDVGNDTDYTFIDIDDGDRTVEVRAWDKAGNTQTDVVNFTVDTTPPDVDITVPEEGEVFDVNEVTVEWTGSDETTGIDHYEIRINEGSWIEKGTETDHTFTSLEDGEHIAEIRAWDNAGNQQIQAVNFTVDTTSPDVEIIIPDEDEILSESDVTVEWTGSDDISGIAYYEVKIDGGNWTNVGMDINHTFENLEDGNRTVEVRAWDNASNNDTDIVTFIVDATPPDIEITAPEDGKPFDTDSVTVEWTGSDETTGIAYYEVKIDGGDWTNVSMDTNHTFEDLEDGDHTVEVRAWDEAGNNNTDSVYFIVDTVPPYVEITSPEDEEVFEVDSVTVTWSGSDETSGIDHYRVRINGEAWVEVGTDTSYTFEDLDEGNHTVEVKAVDAAGNEAVDEVGFIVDIPPSVIITYPEEGDTHRRSELTIEWIGYYNVTDLDFYEIRINDGSWINVGDSTSHTLDDADEGDYFVEVRITDDEERRVVDEVNFTVDTTSLYLEITSPEEDEIFSETQVTVEWFSNDASFHEIRIDGGNWTDVGENKSHTFSDLLDGEHTVDVRAVNATDSYVDSVYFTVDTTFPEVNITEPGENDLFTVSNVTVKWIGGDDVSGIDYYEVKIDGGNWTDVGNNNEYTFADLEDGNRTVEVRAWDKAGNSRIDTVNFTIDTTPPELNVITPEEGEAFDIGEVTVEWEGSDETTGIDHYEIRIDEGDWTVVGENTTHTFSNLTEGEHTVEVRAWDDAGHNNTRSVNFIVDKTLPDISIDVPDEGDILSESDVTIEWTGSDDISGIDYYEVKIDGDTWIDVGNNTEYTFAGVEDGHRTVEVRALDNAGNSRIDTVNFTVDTTPPELEIIYPEEGESFGVDQITVEWEGSDDVTGIDHYEVRLAGEDWMEKGTDTSHTFYELEDGERTVEVRAWDNAGNDNINSVTFIVDTTPPTIDISVPDENAIMTQENVTVEWTGSDETTGIDHYEISINEESWIGKGNDTEHTFFELEDGNYTVEVRAWDNAGNDNIQMVNFIVDTTPPELEITSLEEGEAFDIDEITVEWTGTDETTGIDHYEIRINEEDWINKGTGTTHSFTGLEDGEHYVEVRAWDNAGHNTTTVVNFVVDTTPPVLQIESPQEDEIFDTDSVTVEWECSDETTGIDHYEIRLEGTWEDVGEAESFTFEGLEEGEHTVEVRAWDEAGNYHVEAVNFIVDTTPPEVEIIFPEMAQIVHDSTVTVEWTGTDETSGIDHYQIQLDDDDKIGVGMDTEHTFTDLEDGEYTVEVWAVDAAGNTASDSVEFEVRTDEDIPDILVTGFDVDPTEGEAPLEVIITADLENIGNAEGDINLIIDGEEMMSLTLGPGEDETIEYTHEIEEPGEYEIALGDESIDVTVEKEYTIIIGPIKDQDDDLINDAQVSLSWGEEIQMEMEEGTAGFYNFTLMSTSTLEEIEITYTVEHDSLEGSETADLLGTESGEIILDLESEDQVDDPEEDMIFVEYWWLTLLLILILVVAIVGIILKRRRRPEEEFKEEMPEDSSGSEKPSQDENGLAPSFDDTKEVGGEEIQTEYPTSKEDSIFKESTTQESKDDAKAIPPEEEEVISLLEADVDESEDNDASEESEDSESDRSDLREFIEGKVDEVITYKDDIGIDELTDKFMEIADYQDDRKKMKNIIYAELSFYSEADNDVVRRVSKEITKRAFEDKD